MKKKLIILLVVVLLSLPMAAGAELENSEDIVEEELSEDEILEKLLGTYEAEVYDEAEVTGEVAEDVPPAEPYEGTYEVNREMDEVRVSPGSGGEIVVSGQGSVSVEPDIGYINFSIVESGDDVVEIYRENVATVDGVVDALVDYGLDRADIKTESFNVRDDYRYLPPEERREEPELVVTTNLKVMVEDLDEEMGEVLDIGIESGANRVSSISFDVEEPEEHYYDALEEALPVEPEEITFESQVQVKYSLN